MQLMVVTFKKGRSLFDLIHFKDDMYLLMGRNVDVVTEKSLNCYIRGNVLQEAVKL